MNQTLTVRLPNKIRSELKKISRSEKIPLSDLVRESLKKFIAVYQFRRLRKQVQPFAEAQGLLTDEDVFNTLK